MTNWKEYTGTDEQIAEIKDSKNGFVLILHDGFETSIHPGYEITECLIHEQASPTHYWIIPDDPLREMKIRQAQTGRPVWIRLKGYEKFSPAKYKEYWFDGKYSIVISTTPDWNIPNAEYNFTPFED